MSIPIETIDKKLIFLFMMFLFIFRLKYLTIQVLMDRLVLRRHYPIAIEIAKYLKLPDLEGTSRILAHWACFKVRFV